MISGAITAAIVGFLELLGIPAAPYAAGIWIGVKILLVATVALVGWIVMQKKKRAAIAADRAVPPAAPPAAAPPDPEP
jgi:hypothetical protein